MNTSVEPRAVGKSGAAQVMNMDGESMYETQVATAKRFPRDVQRSMEGAETIACLTTDIAASCLYSLPRSKKAITGPSVRLAEIMVHSWGNMRCESRISDEGQKYIEAESVCWDMENNTAVRTTVRRRITGKNGSRYNDDMITVTGNAAIAIAFRNAVFKVIPASVVDVIYQKARTRALGEEKPTSQRWNDCVAKFAPMGVNEATLLGSLMLDEAAAVTKEDLEVLIGNFNAINNDEVTVEDLFPKAKPAAETPMEPKEVKK